MNERIKLLAEQTHVYAGGHSIFCHESDIKKFAELIVRESGKYLMSPEFIGRSDLDWAMVLNEHFGVE